ncbi:MAG: hypothetical protein ACFFB0_04260 [Promethearchaeota archaeon]
MGFGKAFLLSLVAFIGINFIFTIIYFLLLEDFDTLFSTIAGDPLMILYYLFGSILSIPFYNLKWLVIDPLLNNNMDNLILGLGFLVAPLIAAILAGNFGESKSQCFSGWLLTALVSSIATIIGALLSQTFRTTIETTYEWSTILSIIAFTALSCLINIVFYSFFALAIFKTEYY